MSFFSMVDMGDIQYVRAEICYVIFVDTGRANKKIGVL